VVLGILLWWLTFYSYTFLFSLFSPLFFSFFFPLQTIEIVKIKAMERKKEKELRLPPKKRSFKVKSWPFFYAWSRSNIVWTLTLSIDCPTRYGFNYCPLTVNASGNSLHISMAPLGWTLVTINGLDHQGFSLPGNILNLELSKRTTSPFSNLFFMIWLSCHFLVHSL